MSHYLYCWITMDFWQGFETISKLSIYITVKNPKVSFLTLYHRCTLSVLKEYRKNYNDLIMQAGHQYRGEESETRIVEIQKGEDKMEAWVQTIKNTYDEQIEKGWMNDQIKIILVRPSIYDQDYDTFNLHKKLEMLSPKFDYETLSQEWPVIIIIAPQGKQGDLSIAQSRAVAKIIYIQLPSDVDHCKFFDKFIFVPNNRISHLTLSTIFLKTRMEILAYHQHIHTKKYLLEENMYLAFFEDIKQKIKLALYAENRQHKEIIRAFFNFVILFVSNFFGYHKTVP